MKTFLDATDPEAPAELVQMQIELERARTTYLNAVRHLAARFRGVAQRDPDAGSYEDALRESMEVTVDDEDFPPAMEEAVQPEPEAAAEEQGEQGTGS